MKAYKPFDDSHQKDRRRATEDQNSDLRGSTAFRQGAENTLPSHYAAGIVKIHDAYNEQTGEHGTVQLSLGQEKVGTSGRPRSFKSTWLEPNISGSGAISAILLLLGIGSTVYTATGPSPVVTAISPVLGTSSGGTLVDITVDDSTGATGASVGGVPLTGFTILNGTTVRGTTGAHASGLVDVVVANSFGTGTLSNAFTYGTVPVVVGVVPSQGDVAGGTHIVIEVDDSTGATSADIVTLGALANFAIDDATHVSGDVPAGTVGPTYDVSVTNAFGTGTLSNAFSYLNAPAITSLNYDQGQPEGGGEDIVITGTDFTGATDVKFGTTSATSFTVDSDTQITAVLPAHAAGTANVTVIGPGGTSNAQAFEYWSPASLTLALWLRADGTTGYDVAAGNGTFLDVSGNSRDATSSGGATPPEGSAVNTHIPPSFGGAGSTDMLTCAASFKPIKADGTRYWHASLAKPSEFVVNGLPYQQKPTYINGNGGGFYVGMMWYRDSVEGPAIRDKVVAYHYDGLPRYDAQVQALQAGNWYGAVGWYDGTNINLECNGTTATPDPAGAVNGWDNAGNKVGRNEFSSQDFGGDVLEVMVTGADAASQSYGAAEAALVMKYWRQRYGLALNAIP